MNHPFINLSEYQNVLKLKLIKNDLTTNDITNDEFYNTRNIIDIDDSKFLSNQFDNFSNFYKFSINNTIPIYKYKDIVISEINDVYFQEALDAEITQILI